MILDERTEFSDAQTVTVTAISDVIDLGATPTLRSIQGGEPLYLVITVDEAATAAGAATATFSLESDSTADLATSPTVHFASAAIGKAALTLGSTQVVAPVPTMANVERYLGVRYTVATGPLTAGKFSAFLTPVAPIGTIYPDATN